jgi:putative MATE family efflux protein
MKFIFEIDMLTGILWKKILLFAIPLAGMSILQQLFNAADIAIVGQYVGSSALAAVGANAPVINLLLNLFVGLAVGANVVISILTGKKDSNNIKKTVHTSIILALASGLFLTCIGITLAVPILKYISTPEEIIDLAALYLKIYFLGMPFIMLFNFSSAILRCKGDTQRPLFALIVAGIINVILNLFFVLVFKMSVDGVAIATVVSNIISSILLIYFLIKEEGVLKLSFKDLKVDWKSLIQITKIGIPAGIQGMMYSISNICVQSALNKLGAAVIASTAVALNYEYIVYFLFSAFSQACITFVGQNFGAGKIERCKRVIKACLILSIVVTTVSCIVILYYADFFVRIFTQDELVIKYAILRLLFILSLEFLNIIFEIVSGGIRGFGYSLSPALICMIGICGVRILWIYTIFPIYPTYNVLLSIYPISWAVAAVAVIILYKFIIKKITILTSNKV